MASNNTRDVLLFAGQGSSHHLTNPAAVHGLKELLKDEQLLAFESFLSQCRNALHSEYQSASPEDQALIGVDIVKVFDSPQTLLTPPQSLHSHPLCETLTLYLHQILELFLFQSHENTHHVIETAGVCAGIMPAIIAASFSSYDSEDFILSAVEGFRLAFWVGVRAAGYWSEAAGEGWRDTPSVLGVFGVSVDQLEKKLTALDEGNVTGPKIRTSAIFNDSNISISGHGSRLSQVKSKLANESIQSRWAHVHALYHGGPEMESTLQKTVRDVEKRNIIFPTWESLQVPLRSAADGVRRDAEINPRRHSLLETALRSIFVEKVDWREASKHLQESLNNLLSRDSAAKIRVLGLGPGSRSLVHSLKDLPVQPNVETVDNWAEYLSQPSPDDIAIVGLSVNYPGSKGQDKFWETLEKSKSTVSEIPKSRFDISKSSGASANVKYGNFLDEAFEFDPAYFNISPREAKCIDPQQRLLLHGALEALEDAGYNPNSTPSFQKDSFGVYVGVATGDYVDNLRDNIDVYYSPGTLRAFLAGRISYAFKFKGPSMVIDTACSGSLVALHRACMALQTGECTAALAGGVNVMTSPDMYLGLGRAHFLSPTGQCKPFDEAADGYCRAEGCGLVVVKKLAQAVEEGDHIYGVIRGIGLNQCGTAKSITHPDAETQADLVRSVLKSSRVTPDSINVVEAHGTGTQAGDYAEVSGLQSIFGGRQPSNPLYISSVKGNFGHAEAASGVAGLAKLLLMMEHKKIPPQASHKKLNPRLQKLLGDSIVVPTRIEDWNKISGISNRRALLNNFGASGSNAALVVEQYVRPPSRTSSALTEPARAKPSHHVLTLSAKSEKALEALRETYLAYLINNPELSLEDICYSANSRRQEHSAYKNSIVATSATDAIDRLRKLSGPDKSSRAKDKRKTVFAFSGQGSVHKGMGSDLLLTAPRFRQIVDEFDRVLSENGFPIVSTFLANTGITGESKDSAADDVIISQCACFVIEYALARLWMSWNIVPDIVIGHSIGEYAAFAIAGAIEPNEALLLVARRAKLMVSKCVPESTGMMACRIPAAELNDLMNSGSEDFKGMSVSCMNGPQDFVLAGPLASLSKFAEYCKGKGFKCKQLPVPFGFHSAAMDPMLQDLAESAAEVTAKTPSIQVGSSLHGRVPEPGSTIEPSYFVSHAREPVNFTGLIEDVANWAAGSEMTVIEIGPSPSTESMFKQTLGPKPPTFLASLKPSQNSWATLAAGLQTLYLQDYQINWRGVYRGTSAKFLRSLPRYPLSTASYYIPYKHIEGGSTIGESGKAKEPEKPRFAFLKAGPPAVKEDSMVYSTALEQIGRFIKAHSVGGVPLCPASVYLEIAVQAATSQNNLNLEKSLCIIDDVAFDHPLVYTEEPDTKGNVGVQTQLTSAPSSSITKFSSMSSTGQIFCTGSLRALEKSTQNVADLLNRKQAKTQRLKRSFPWESRNFTETFSTRTIYDIIFPRVVEYSDPFLTLQQLTVSSSGLEGHGIFKLAPPVADSNGRFVSSPVLVDTLLHAAGFIANTYVASDIACICVSLDQALVPSDSEDLYGQDLQVYCTLGDIEHSVVADAYAISSDGKVVAYVEGMSFKKIKLKSFRAHLSRTASRTVPSPATTSNVSKRPVSDAVARPRADTAPRKQIHRAGPQSSNIVASILRDLCGSDVDPTPQISLAEMGVDSLLLIELAEILHKRFPNAKIGREDIENCETVGELFKVVGTADEHHEDALSDTEQLADTPFLVHTQGTSSAGSVSGVETPLTDTNVTFSDSLPLVKSIFVDVCGLDPTGEKDQVLSSLGVDSLMSIELSQELRGRLGIEIDQHEENISELTYQELENLCASKAPQRSLQAGNHGAPILPEKKPSTKAPKENSLTVNHKSATFPRPLQTGPVGKSSLYLFHDGSGLSSMYGRLSSINRNVFGIHSINSPLDPAPDYSRSPIQTMEQLAESYIERAELHLIDNIILGGWSFGGVLAFEVSRQLQKRGKSVKGLVLIDSPVPINHVGLPAEVISYVLSKGSNGSGGRSGNSNALQEAREAIEIQFKRHAAMLQNYQPAPIDSANGSGDVPCVVLRCAQTLDTDKICGVTYPWLSDSNFSKESVRKWEELLGRHIPVMELECAHFDVFESANIEAVTKKLNVACDLLENSQ